MTPKLYRNFTIRAYSDESLGEKEYYVQVQEDISSGGVEANEKEKCSYDDLDNPNHNFQKRLSQVESRRIEGKDIPELGKLLTKLLLRGSVEKRLRESLKIVRQKNECLRLRLTIEIQKMAAMPWEFLYLPKETQSQSEESDLNFLILNKDISIVRDDGHKPQLQLEYRNQYRLVAAMSLPKDLLNDIQVEKDLDAIEQAIKKKTVIDDITPVWVKHATRDSLQKNLNEQTDIFHFAGHGKFDGEKGNLLLEKDDRESDLYEGKHLSYLLSNAKVKLAVFGACETASTSQHKFRGLAAQLFKDGLLAVVASQYKLSDQNAQILAAQLYPSVLAGETIDEAVSKVRLAILNKNPFEDCGWAALVLYHRVEDGVIFPFVKPEDVKDFLENIENDEKFNSFRLFHSQQPIDLKNQYIPIQVTLKRRYKYDVETTRGYADSEVELTRIYVQQNIDEPQRDQKTWEEVKKEQELQEKNNNQNRRITVLADPGMGKSTLLKREASSTANIEKQKGDANDIILPLFLRLADLAKQAGEIIDAIPILIQRDYPKTAIKIQSFLRSKLKKGKCLLLLDALDEVPKATQLRDLKAKLKRFAENNSCPIVCTSRIVGYGGAIENATVVEIVPFSQKKIEEYIKTWFSNAGDRIKKSSASPEGLIRELRNKPQIGGLSQNPLLLSMLCSLYQEEKLELPANRTKVYEKAVDYILSTWSIQNSRSEPEDGEVAVKKGLLQYLAYHFTYEDKQTFSLSELHKKIKKYLEDNEECNRIEKTQEFIKKLAEEDGIIQKLSREDDQYLFLHKTFQEYLTAVYLEETSNSIDLAREHFWKYEWHETLTLLAGLMEDKAQARFIKAITDEKDDIFYTLRLLAGRCLAECVQCKNNNSLVAEIYDSWHRYPSTNFIHSTVVALGQVNSPMFEKLKNALEDHEESMQIRREAALALGEIRNPEAVPALVDALKSADPYLKRQAALSLGDISTPKAVKALIECLKDPAYVVNHGSLYGGDKGNEIRSVLARIGNREVVDELTKAFNQQEAEISFRRQAALTLAKIGNDLADNRAVKVLITGLYDQSNSKAVQAMVASALGEISNSQEVVEALITVLKNKKKNFDIRKQSTWALRNIGNDKAVETLISILNDKEEDTDVRKQTIEALTKIGRSEAVQAIITACDDQNKFVKKPALSALGKIANPDAMPTLQTAANNPKGSDAVKQKAELALNNIKTQKEQKEAPEKTNFTLPDIIEILKSAPIESTLNKAVSDLRNINDPQAIQHLINALNDIENQNQPFLKSQVASALGRLGQNNDQAIDTLIFALKDKDRDVIRAAASALDQIGTAKTLEQLIKRADINIYDPDIFHLARKLSVKLSLTNPKPEVVPVYPTKLTG